MFQIALCQAYSEILFPAGVYEWCKCSNIVPNFHVWEMSIVKYSSGVCLSDVNVTS